MTVVRFTNGDKVDVIDADCEHRPCYALGFDKGSFTQGRGYTSYYPDGPRKVCWQRHMSGCPHVAVHLVCFDCRAVLGEEPYDAPRPTPTLPCPECGGERVYYLADVLPPPRPCCDAPSVARNPKAWTQRCRSCGTTLRGRRLELARAAQ